MAEPADQVKPKRGDIMVAFYEGAYGPTIRIGIQTEEQLVAFARLIESLVNVRTREIGLHNMQSSFELVGIEAMTMRLVSGKKPLKALELLHGKTKKKEVVWSLDQDGWLRCVGLIEGLMETHASGHQYLTREGIDDALVELSFKEQPSAESMSPGINPQ